MNKQIYFYLTVIVAILIVLLSAFIITNIEWEEYKYSVTRNGVEFVSNIDEPAVLLQELRETDSFLVSPEFVKQGPENAYMVSPLIIFSTVLSAKQKNLLTVGRVFEDGELLECQSNLGEVLTNKEISKEECEQLLNDEIYAKIFVAMPDSSLSNPKVILEKGVMHIYPTSFDDVSDVSFIAIEAMYPDAEAIIDSVNEIVSRI